MHFEMQNPGPLAPSDAGVFKRLKLLPFDGSDTPVSTKLPVVVVLVEARLIENPGGASTEVADLIDRLERFNTDLRNDGFDSRFLMIEMKATPGHRDGEGVLALRQFLQDQHTKHPTMSGVILIGSFPEAMLVRRWMWRKNNRTIWINGTEHTNTDYLRIVPEIIAKRSDLVLADLTGNWAALYQAGPTQVPSIQAIPEANAPAGWPIDGGLLISSTFQVDTPSFTDFFWIRDDDFQMIPDPTGSNRLILRTFRGRRNPEVSAADLALANPLARPDIFVSRINARNVAWSPDMSITGTAGEKLLDVAGKPQEIATGLTLLADRYQQCPLLERKLIIDYLDRNHRMRQGISVLSSEYRTSAINGFPDDPDPTKFDTWAKQMSAYLETASTVFKPPVVTEHANVLDFVNWMKEPAILKGIITHANCHGTLWDNTPYATADLESEAGGDPWRWQWSLEADGLHYTPSFAAQGDWSDFHVYRTIWENGVLAKQHPAIIIHTGCHVNSPCNSETQTYDSASYARAQEGEGFLFYLNAAAVISRAKDINDWPEEFPAALAQKGARLGDGWKRYFDKDGADASLEDFDKMTRCKDSYWWGILGDWTLKLSYTPVLILPFIPPQLRIVPFEKPWWVLTDNRGIVKTFGDEALATRAFEIIQHFGFDARHVVGGAREAWEFYLADGDLPSGPMEGEQAVAVDAEALQVVEAGEGWEVRAGKARVATLGVETDAWSVVEAIRSHRATHFCWVGDREVPAMTYLRR